MSRLLKLEVTPRGTVTKAEAVEYVGGPDFFEELVRDHGLCPCRELRTRVLYRIAELDRCVLAAEEIIRNRRASRAEKGADA